MRLELSMADTTGFDILDPLLLWYVKAAAVLLLEKSLLSWLNVMLECWSVGVVQVEKL